MKLKDLLLALVSLATLSGCDMMKEDVDDTYCGLFVNFKYDYNLQRADMFKDHVGGVTLYVFDSNGGFVRTYEANNIPQMGTLLYDGTYAYCMHITDLPDGSYRFIALASQKPYQETLVTPGAKYRRSDLQPGSSMESLSVALDRSGGAVSNAAPLDTLWHGMSGGQPVVVNNHGYCVTTIPLVRDTKMLTIGLHHLDEDKRLKISADDFDFVIRDKNGRIAYDNAVVEEETLVYTPFRKWDTQTLDEQGAAVDRTAHASLTFNRLMLHDSIGEDAILTITNKEDGKEVARINLPEFLSQGRNAIDTYRYGPQEYLDRGYDFYMDFFLKGGEWHEIELSVGVGLHILSWARRIQRVDIEE